MKKAPNFPSLFGPPPEPEAPSQPATGTTSLIEPVAPAGSLPGPREANNYDQVSLFATGEAWEEEWRGMPEFVSEDLEPFKTIYVHFEKRSDMEEFASLVKQRIGIDTRSIWYPEAEIGRLANKRYVKSENR